MIPYLGITVLLSALISVLTLHFLVDLLVAVLDEEKSVSSGSVNGCDVWPWAVIISTGVCFVAWGRIGYLGLGFAPSGTLLVALLVSLRLRFGDRAGRRRQFSVEGEKALSTKDGRQLFPQYLVDESSYYCTGPASGYCLYSIKLKSAQGTLASNGYVDEQEMQRDLKALIEDIGVKRLSLTFVAQEGPAFRTHNLDDELAGLILTRGSELPGDEHGWWQQFVQPGFEEDVVVEVSPRMLQSRLEALASCFAGDIARSAGLQREVEGVLAFAGDAHSSVWAMSPKMFSEFVKESPVEIRLAAPRSDQAAEPE
ncbi:MAG: hypothetical protein GTO46_03935 [Gemmatimonadetes bacterium]|nr:hypothetical protein [Gemmatimonadota bacterium]NIO32951.1 hypothetical protein [Gemmatimonadota bacterium]